MAIEDYVDAFARKWAAANATNAAAGSASLTLIARVERLHGRLDEARAAGLRRYGLSRKEYDILSVVHAAGPTHGLRSTDIARRILITSGGTSTTLRRLHERGLVTRERDPHDARSTWVRITEAGATIVAAAADDVVPAQAALLHPAPPGAVQQAEDALRAVLVALGDLPPPER
jgi:DNA-binding MarR family transcriptional regulator